MSQPQHAGGSPMTRAAEWSHIDLSKGANSKPVKVETHFSTQDLAVRGTQILEELQRPLSPREREDALKRSTVYTL